MKKFIVPIGIALSTAMLLGGCVAAGTGSRTIIEKPTVGQQLMDLKKARDIGAINEAEYESQKTKLLQQ